MLPFHQYMVSPKLAQWRSTWVSEMALFPDLAGGKLSLLEKQKSLKTE